MPCLRDAKGSERAIRLNVGQRGGAICNPELLTAGFRTQDYILQRAVVGWLVVGHLVGGYTNDGVMSWGVRIAPSEDLLTTGAIACRIAPREVSTTLDVYGVGTTAHSSWRSSGASAITCSSGRSRGFGGGKLKSRRSPVKLSVQKGASHRAS